MPRFSTTMSPGTVAFFAYFGVGILAIPILEIEIGELLTEPAGSVSMRSLAGWLFIAATSPIVRSVVNRYHDGAVESRYLAQKMIAHTRDGVLLTAPDGRVMSANPAACRIFGCSEREIIRRGRGMVIDENDPEVQEWLQRRRTDGFVEGEIWGRRVDGEPIRIEVTSTVFRHRGEERTAMIVRNVTERNYSAYCMRLMDAAFQTQNLGIGVLDAQWRILWINDGAEKNTGFRLSGLVGRRPPFHSHLERTNPSLLQRVRQTVDTDGLWTGELDTVRADGTAYPVHGHVRRVQGPDAGEIRYVVAFSDRSVERDYEQRLRDMTFKDPITGLPNRGYFEQRLDDHLTAVASLPTMATVFLVELDHFIRVNESLGHQAGDLALSKAAGRLTDLFGDGAVVVRHSGPGFFAFMPVLTSFRQDTTPLLTKVEGREEKDARIVDRILSAFRRPLDLFGQRVTLTVSIGISVYPDDGADTPDLMRKAEAAAQTAKESGGDTYRRFDDTSEHQSRTFVALSAALDKDLLESQAFQAWFQPIVDAHTHEPVCMEVLARWHSAEHGWVSPAEFIPVAERTGLIQRLSDRILHQTCNHLSRCNDAGLEHLCAAVNLSPRQFREQELVERIIGIVEEKAIDPSRLTFEITESQIMQNPDSAKDVLQRLRAAGMKVVLDDFGVGYSSLNYLRLFQVDGVKIDRSFIANLPDDRRDAAIFRAIVAVAYELELSVVAEGVENEEQAEYLRDAGCDRLQGFLFCPAIPSDQFLGRFAR